MPCKNAKELIEVACAKCGSSILKQRDSIRRWSGVCRSCSTKSQIKEGKINLKANTIHLETETPLWNVWRSARKQWLKYQREINITFPYFEKWSDYKVFKEWALLNGYTEGLSLLRKVHEDGWTPENCYFHKFNIVKTLTKTCSICNAIYTTTFPNSVSCSVKCAGLYRGNLKRSKYKADPSLKFNALVNRKLESAFKRSKEKNQDFDISTDYIHSLYIKQNKKCALTGIELTFITKKEKVLTNLSIDRIDSSKGYTKDNVQLVCTVVNLMKLDLDLNEFKRWCQLIANNHD